MRIGRKILYTDVPEITYQNVIPILQELIAYHESNANRMDYLLRYDAGEQPLQRKEPKSYRKDIDCHYVDNVANEITEFKVGFMWGNPITFVQRGEKDAGKTDEPLSISLLNEQYEAENISAKTQELARYVEICGLGYTYIDLNTNWEDGDAYFKLNVLNPQFTFVVRSSYYADHRIMLGVMYRKDNNGNRYFTCFSKNWRWEIENLAKITNGNVVESEEKWWHKTRSGEKNPLGRIPIIEWQRSYDRMGCFERQISAMDNLNLMESDFMNDVEQNTQAIWHGNDIDFPVDENGNEKRPQTNEWIITQTTQDGKTPFVKPLAVEYNYSGILEKISHDRDTILQNAFVPLTSDGSNSTGIAQSYATGFTAAEMVAEKQQCIMDSCKMEELRVVLSAIKQSTDIEADSPLLTLRYSDVKPKIKRNKNYELVSKSNALATLLSHGIYGLHAIKEVNLFADENQVWEDSKELIEKYQSSIFDKQETKQTDIPDRLEQDSSDQVQNSPLIDGISTQPQENTNS